MNENGKLDEQDVEFISLCEAYLLDFSPYYMKNEDWWIFCYYNIIGDPNSDSICEGTDRSIVELYLSDQSDILEVVSPYDIYDTALNWNEEELKSYNY